MVQDLRVGVSILEVSMHGILVDTHIADPTTLMILGGQIENKGITFTPVILTREIVEMLGFKGCAYDRAYSHYFEADYKNIIIHFPRQGEPTGLVCGVEFCDEYILDDNLIYLHQLQNFWKSVVGTELAVDMDKLKEILKVK